MSRAPALRSLLCVVNARFVAQVFDCRTCGVGKPQPNYLDNISVCVCVCRRRLTATTLERLGFAATMLSAELSECHILYVGWGGGGAGGAQREPTARKAKKMKSAFRQSARPQCNCTWKALRCRPAACPEHAARCDSEAASWPGYEARSLIYCAMRIRC